jgi:hypothetical protein
MRQGSSFVKNGNNCARLKGLLKATSSSSAPGRGVREVNGETRYFWRAGDHEADVLETLSQSAVIAWQP